MLQQWNLKNKDLFTFSESVVLAVYNNLMRAKLRPACVFHGSLTFFRTETKIKSPQSYFNKTTKLFPCDMKVRKEKQISFLPGMAGANASSVRPDATPWVQETADGVKEIGTFYDFQIPMRAAFPACTYRKITFGESIFCTLGVYQIMKNGISSSRYEHLCHLYNCEVKRVLKRLKFTGEDQAFVFSRSEETRCSHHQQRI